MQLLSFFLPSFVTLTKLRDFVHPHNFTVFNSVMKQRNSIIRV